MNPNVNDLTRTPTWAPGKFSFRCMTLGYFQPPIFIPHQLSDAHILEVSKFEVLTKASPCCRVRRGLQKSWPEWSQGRQEPRTTWLVSDHLGRAGRHTLLFAQLQSATTSLCKMIMRPLGEAHLKCSVVNPR